jgi:hypothetical protein
MFKSFVQNAFHIANHFHQFHSELTRIEAGAFACTHLSPVVVVPGRALFIAGDAFPSYCAVASAWPNSDAGLSEWNLRHQSGSSDAFERKL